MATNQKVDTPLGEGIEQGKWIIFDGNGTVIAFRRLVRFKLTDEVVKHLRDRNCVTPNAQGSALFHFPIGEAIHE